MKSFFSVIIAVFFISFFVSAEFEAKENYENSNELSSIELANHVYYMNTILNEPYHILPSNPKVCTSASNRYAELQKKSNIDRRNYDILKYHLEADWTPLFMGSDSTFEYKEWSGKSTITLSMEEDNVKSLEFDARLIIDSVKYDSKSLIYKVDDINGVLTVELEKTLLKDQTIILEIYYRCNNVNKGIYLAEKGTFIDRSYKPDSYTDEKIVYTQSEPTDARFWFPVNDRPYDKIMFSTSVTVPEGITVSSNGTLIKAPIQDGKQTFIFESQYPMAPYLLVINASKFYTYTDMYQNGEQKIPFNYYLWEDDLEGKGEYEFNFKKAFHNHFNMMDMFQEKFTTYPYESYGITVAEPYHVGGMEHQTMTTVNRSWLWNTAERGIAHELAHQWLGNLITCATWGDVWINEGGATWSEALWVGDEYHRKFYYITLENNRGLYLKYGKEYPKLYNTPLYNVTGNTAFREYNIIVYQKASWIYHMLNEWSDGRFMKALRGVLTEYAYTSTETEDIKKGLKNQNFDFPIDLETYFDNWVYHAGHPIYAMSGTTENVKENVFVNRIRLNQIQEGEFIPDVFDVMQKIRFFDIKTNREAKFVFRNNQRVQDTTFITDFKPTHFTLNKFYTLFDSEKDIIALTPVSIEDDVATGIYIAPNKVNSGNTATIYFENIVSPNTTVEIYTATGEKVGIINNDGNSKSLTINTQNLATGLYFVYVNTGDKVIVKQLMVI